MLNALYCTRLRFEILKFPFGIKLPDSVSYSNSNNISWIYITTEKQNLTIFRSSVKQETGRFFNIDIPWIHFGNLFLYFQKKKSQFMKNEIWRKENKNMYLRIWLLSFRHRETFSSRPKELQMWRLHLLLCFLLCGSRHQQQVAGHKLDIEHVAGVSSVHSHQFAGRAVSWRPTVWVADVPHPHWVVHRWRCH